MLYSKITPGMVRQIFNDQGECIAQEFIASNEDVEYEQMDVTPEYIFDIVPNLKGVIPRYSPEYAVEINSEDMPFCGNEYYPFIMEQPTNNENIL